MRSRSSVLRYAASRTTNATTTTTSTSNNHSNSSYRARSNGEQPAQPELKCRKRNKGAANGNAATNVATPAQRGHGASLDPISTQLAEVIRKQNETAALQTTQDQLKTIHQGMGSAKRVLFTLAAARTGRSFGDIYC
ncbi:hypothetical protein FDECE_4070 [Fusarium decemcellulare]|nr:hypothetical protein FDECE_4070 [Fusarium decemcellulare]